MKKIILLLSLVFLLNGSVATADNNILINEIQIEPEQSIEIINKGQDAIDISGWYLDDNGGATFFDIPQNTILYSNSCLVFTSNFNLNKSSSDTVRLFDNTAPPVSALSNLVDSYTYSSSPGPGLSFFLLTDYLTWTTGAASIGLFNISDSSCIIAPTSPPSPSPSALPSPTIPLSPSITMTPSPTIPLQSHANIYISEVMVYPDKGENEWVELYNDNEFPVALTNWYLDDSENLGSIPKQFSLLIPSKSYMILELSSAVFNNSGDGVRLLDSTKNLKDSFEYSATEQGKTLGRVSIDSDMFCLQSPSRESSNNTCIDDLISPTIFKNSSNTKILLPSPVSPVKVYQTVPPRNTINKPQVFMKSQVLSATNVKPSLKNKSEVLGIADDQKVSELKKPLIRTFSFLSFSYSLMSMLSILWKIKTSWVG